MEESDIKAQILRHLYAAWFSPESDGNLKDLLQREGWSSESFWNLVDRMTHDGLIAPSKLGGVYKIASLGVIHCESNGYAPDELIRTNQQTRIFILNALAKVYEEQGSLYTVGSYELCQQAGLDQKLISDNIQVLMGLGQVEFKGNARFKLMYQGLDTVKKLRQQASIAEEFARISQLSPQPRGRALQKFLAKIIGQQGWEQEDGVRTSNEEMDIVISRGRDFYLFECKWEKDAIEAAVIRELFGKLSNRFDVKGIAVSMSGFTGGSKRQVIQYLGQRVILLFGPNDVNSLVNGESVFEALLNAKYKQLVSRSKVIFD